MIREISFNVNDGHSRYTVEHEELSRYAKAFGLDKIIPERFSWFFVFNLLMNERGLKLDPENVIYEILVLEGLKTSRGTRPATKFKHLPLKGLWHKHFFAANLSIMAHNMQNQLANGRLGKIVREVFDRDISPVVTKKMIAELAQRVTAHQIERAAEASVLTGEWIVFAKHEGQNYYLSIEAHDAGDEKIAQNIKAACLPQFPFLGSYLS